MDLPHPGIKRGSPALQVDSLPAELSGKPNQRVWVIPLSKCPETELDLCGKTASEQLHGQEFRNDYGAFLCWPQKVATAWGENQAFQLSA